ncbi:MBL fold metallo-hydrolase [Chitinimonas taiwanensis]|uniref:MBL fold metallo-hydrolase n=1 Tax=Chitinimonas taiwanensis TaxID=240412 RepID=UPI0035AF3980
MSAPVRRIIQASVLALGLSAVTLAVATIQPAHAAPPEQQRVQVPGFYRMALGDFEVTALYDGYIDLDQKILKHTSARDLQSLLARMFIDTSKGMQTAVNAYLVHTGSQLVLVDAGAAQCFGPTLGNLRANIEAAGYRLEQVDSVLLTHLHADHACGLSTPDGQMAFPNAQVWAAQAEADFWLSEAVAAKAPAEAQGFFKLARQSVAPYQAAGRFHTFKPGENPLPALRVMPTPGHTPGHSSFLFSSKGQSLLVWGDIVHSHASQFARPEIAIEFDIDSQQAVATRKQLFAAASRDKLWVAGAHLPFPGLGHVRAEAKGYAWVPIEYGPLRSDR